MAVTLGHGRTRTQRAGLCPHILSLLQMEATHWHQMGLQWESHRGVQQGTAWSNVDLEIALASVQEWIVTRRSRDTSWEMDRGTREERKMVVSLQRRNGFHF